VKHCVSKNSKVRISSPTATVLGLRRYSNKKVNASEVEKKD
jgi:hypothetical protein